VRVWSLIHAPIRRSQVRGRAADKDTLWPQIVEAVTRLFDRARAAGVVRAGPQPEDAAVTCFRDLGCSHRREQIWSSKRVIEAPQIVLQRRGIQH
jgi:hypothetical protein